MRQCLRSTAIVVTAAIATYLSTPTEAKAYEADCAILICLAGGFPASSECLEAQAEFIERITPWPIEPPLQIWRCPMSGSNERTTSALGSLFDSTRRYNDTDNGGLMAQLTNRQFGSLTSHLTTNNTADIDISGPEFDFVRSIVVWDIRTYRTQRDEDGNCNTTFNGYKGSYDRQGRYSTRAARLREVPRWVIPNRSCFFLSSRRGVGVEWRSQANEHDYEWVSY